MKSLAATYADIARRAPVLSSAAQELGLTTDWSGLSKSVEIRVPDASPQVIEITTRSGSAVRAQNIAAAISASLVGYANQTRDDAEFVSPQLVDLEQAIEDGQQEIGALQERQRTMGNRAPASLQSEILRLQEQVSAWRSNYASFKQLASSSSHVGVRELDPASVSPEPVSPDIGFNTVMGGFAGLLLGLALAYLLEARTSRQTGSEPESSPMQGSPLILPPGVVRVTPSRNGASGRAVGATNGRVRDGEVGKAGTSRTSERHEGEAR
jgi:uncharacterized protein involved in exopolysaccharide biosynthesis